MVGFLFRAALAALGLWLATRLVGGPTTANALNAFQSGAMGEEGGMIDPDGRK